MHFHLKLEINILHVTIQMMLEAVKNKNYQKQHYMQTIIKQISHLKTLHFTDLLINNC